MSFEELLLSLQPAHTPPDPGFWPPAPGYWIVAAIMFAALASAREWRARRRGNTLFKRALSELDAIDVQHEASGDDTETAAALSRWLRKVALLAYPHQSAAGVTGDRWLEFLDQSVADSPFTQGVGQVFARDVYRRDIGIDAAALLPLCRSWLAGVRAALEQADTPPWRHSSDREFQRCDKSANNSPTSAAVNAVADITID